MTLGFLVFRLHKIRWETVLRYEAAGKDPVAVFVDGKNDSSLSVC